MVDEQISQEQRDYIDSAWMDPAFHKLPLEDRRSWMNANDPDFLKLTYGDQDKLFAKAYKLHGVAQPKPVAEQNAKAETARAASDAAALADPFDPTANPIKVPMSDQFTLNDKRSREAGMRAIPHLRLLPSPEDLIVKAAQEKQAAPPQAPPTPAQQTRPVLTMPGSTGAIPGQVTAQDLPAGMTSQIGSGFQSGSANLWKMTGNAAEMAENALDPNEPYGRIALSPLRAVPGLRDVAKGAKEFARGYQTVAEQEAARLAGGRTDAASQILRGAAQAPADLAAYGVGSEVLGPIGGMAGVDALREADKGLVPALEAGAKGAVTGGAFEMMNPLTRPLKIAGGAALGALPPALEGRPLEDVVAGGVTMGGLAGMHGGPVDAKEVARTAADYYGGRMPLKEPPVRSLDKMSPQELLYWTRDEQRQNREGDVNMAGTELAGRPLRHEPPPTLADITGGAQVRTRTPEGRLGPLETLPVQPSTGHPAARPLERPPNREERRAGVAPPETMGSEDSERDRDARARLAQRYFGKRFGELEEEERAAVDAGLRKGHGYAAQPGEEDLPAEPPKMDWSGSNDEQLQWYVDHYRDLGGTDENELASAWREIERRRSSEAPIENETVPHPISEHPDWETWTDADRRLHTISPDTGQIYQFDRDYGWNPVGKPEAKAQVKPPAPEPEPGHPARQQPVAETEGVVREPQVAGHDETGGEEETPDFTPYWARTNKGELVQVVSGPDPVYGNRVQANARDGKSYILDPETLTAVPEDQAAAFDKEAKDREDRAKKAAEAAAKPLPVRPPLEVPYPGEAVPRGDEFEHEGQRYRVKGYGQLDIKTGKQQFEVQASNPDGSSSRTLKFNTAKEAADYFGKPIEGIEATGWEPPEPDLSEEQEATLERLKPTGAVGGGAHWNDKDGSVHVLNRGWDGTHRQIVTRIARDGTLSEGDFIPGGSVPMKDVKGAPHQGNEPEWMSGQEPGERTLNDRINDRDTIYHGTDMDGFRAVINEGEIRPGTDIGREGTVPGVSISRVPAPASESGTTSAAKRKITFVIDAKKAPRVDPFVERGYGYGKTRDPQADWNSIPKDVQEKIRDLVDDYDDAMARGDEEAADLAQEQKVELLKPYLNAKPNTAFEFEGRTRNQPVPLSTVKEIIVNREAVSDADLAEVREAADAAGIPVRVLANGREVFSERIRRDQPGHPAARRQGGSSQGEPAKPYKREGAFPDYNDEELKNVFDSWVKAGGSKSDPEYTLMKQELASRQRQAEAQAKADEARRKQAEAEQRASGHPAGRPQPTEKPVTTMAKVKELQEEAERVLAQPVATDSFGQTEQVLALGNLEKALDMLPADFPPQMRTRLEVLRNKLREHLRPKDEFDDTSDLDEGNGTPEMAPPLDLKNSPTKDGEYQVVRAYMGLTDPRVDLTNAEIMRRALAAGSKKRYNTVTDKEIYFATLKNFKEGRIDQEDMDRALAAMGEGEPEAEPAGHPAGRKPAEPEADEGSLHSTVLRMHADIEAAKGETAKLVAAIPKKTKKADLGRLLSEAQEPVNNAKAALANHLRGLGYGSYEPVNFEYKGNRIEGRLGGSGLNINVAPPYRIENGRVQFIVENSSKFDAGYKGPPGDRGYVDLENLTPGRLEKEQGNPAARKPAPEPEEEPAAPKYAKGSIVEWQYGKKTRKGEVRITPDEQTHPGNKDKYFIHSGSEGHIVHKDKILREITPAPPRKTNIEELEKRAYYTAEPNIAGLPVQFLTPESNYMTGKTLGYRLGMNAKGSFDATKHPVAVEGADGKRYWVPVNEMQNQGEWLKGYMERAQGQGNPAARPKDINARIAELEEIVRGHAINAPEDASKVHDALKELTDLSRQRDDARIAVLEAQDDLTKAQTLELAKLRAGKGATEEPPAKEDYGEAEADAWEEANNWYKERGVSENDFEAEQEALGTGKYSVEAGRKFEKKREQAVIDALKNGEDVPAGVLEDFADSPAVVKAAKEAAEKPAGHPAAHPPEAEEETPPAPPVPDGMVRLYRGSTTRDREDVPHIPPVGAMERGRWFSTDPTIADTKIYGDHVFYVDVPQEVADEAREPDTMYNKTGRLLPAEYANQAKLYAPPKPEVAHPAARLGKKEKENLPVKDEPTVDEAPPPRKITAKTKLKPDEWRDVFNESLEGIRRIAPTLEEGEWSDDLAEHHANLTRAAAEIDFKKSSKLQRRFHQEVPADKRQPLDIADAYEEAFTAPDTENSAEENEISADENEKPVTRFTTAKGSTYVVNGDSTTRTKSLHQGHDPSDVGEKEPSHRTVYVDPKFATEVGQWNTLSSKDKTISINRDGTVTLISTGPGGKPGRDPLISDNRFSTKPEVGLAPLELFKPGTMEGVYRGNHPGNEITEISAEPTEKSAEPAAKPEPKVSKTEKSATPKIPKEIHQSGDAVQVRVTTEKGDEWVDGEVHEVKKNTEGEPVYQVETQNRNDPADKDFNDYRPADVRAAEPVADKEADFQQRFKEGIAETRRRNYVDKVDDIAALKTVNSLTKDLLEGKGMAHASAGKDNAVIHENSEVIGKGKNRTTRTKYLAVIDRPGKKNIQQEFTDARQAAAWTTDVLHGIGFPPGWDGENLYNSYGRASVNDLLKRGTLLMPNEAALAASEAAARAIGKPGAANAIYRDAFAGGAWSATAEPNLKLADVATKYAAGMPRNLENFHELSDRRDQFQRDVNQALMRDTPPEHPIRGWTWESQLEHFERNAKGLEEQELHGMDRRIELAKRLNGGETSPRIAESEKMVADARRNIKQNLKAAQDAVKETRAAEKEKLEPGVREDAEAYAKYGEAAFTNRSSLNPEINRNRYAKLADLESAGWPAIMEHFGIESQEKPERIKLPMNGPAKLTKAEIEALDTADLASGGIRVKDQGTLEKLTNRGWVDEKGVLTEKGKSAVYSHRAGTEELKAGLPMKDYEPKSKKLVQLEGRFGGGGAWGKVGDDVWYTNGHGAWKGEFPAHWSPRDKTAKGPDLNKVIPDAKGDVVKPIGFATANPGDKKAQTLIYFDNANVAMDAEYYDHSLKEGVVKWTVGEGKAAPFQGWDKDGKRIALVMPMRIDKVPEGLKGKEPEPTPTGNPAARKRNPKTGMVSVDMLTGGTPRWIQEDLIPAVGEAKKGLVEAADAFQRGFAPQTLDNVAEKTGYALREYNAERAHETEQAIVALKKARKYFQGKDFETEILPFLDKMEKGEKQDNPELQPFADEMRKQLDRRRDEIRELGTGKLQKYYTDYFPHLWKFDDRAREIFMDVVSRGPTFEGNSKDRFKKRSIDSIAEGVLEHKLKPKYENPVESVLAAMHQMDKYILAHKTLNWMKEQKMTKYLPVEKQTHGAGQGWIKYDDPIFTRYGKPSFELTEFNDAQLTQRTNALAQALGIKHERYINPPKGGPGTAGYTQKGTDTVVTKFATPESVLIHEIGHQLEFRYGLMDKLKGIKGIGSELRDLADLRYEDTKVSENYKSYVRNKDEKMANAIMALVYAPEKFKEVAPITWDALRDELYSHKELRPIFDLDRSLVLGSNKMKVDMPGITTLGHYYIPKGSAGVFRNFLSQGLRKYGAFRAYLGSANMMNQFQLGLSAYHAGFTVFDSWMSKAALANQQASRGNFKDAALSVAKIPAAPAANLIRGHKLLKAYETNPQTADMARMVNAVVAGGGRSRQDSVYATKFADKWMDAVKAWKLPKAALLSAPALADIASRPIMEWMVPRMKLGAFADMAKMEMQRLDKLESHWQDISEKHYDEEKEAYNMEAIASDPALDKKGKMEARAQLALLPKSAEGHTEGPLVVSQELKRKTFGQAWDSVDNRMGQMVYDNQFFHKTLKDLMMASVRSVGWNVGTLKEHGGGLWDMSPQNIKKRLAEGDPVVTSRMAYLAATPIVVGLIGSAMTYLATGKRPDEVKDLFFPKTGSTDINGRDERRSLPTYMRDWAHLALAAEDRDRDAVGRMLTAKTHPAIAAVSELLNNEDYYGTQVIDKDHVGKSLWNWGKNTMTPFAVRALQKETELGGTPASKALPFVGITPAPSFLNKTRMERFMDKASGGRVSRESRTIEQFERGKVMRDITREARLDHQDKVGELARQGVKEGTITAKDAVTAYKRAESYPVQLQFKAMDAPHALEALKRADEEELKELMPAFRKKLASYLREKSGNQRETIIRDLKESGLLPMVQQQAGHPASR